MKKTMKIALMLVVALLLVSFTGCSSAESYARQGYDFSKVDKLAIVDVIGPVGGEAAKNQIADMFSMELMKKGYMLIERSQVQVILKEQKFQASDVTSSEGIAKAGEILNVPVILFINVPKFKEDMNISAKMVDVQDGSILWLGSGTGSGGKTLATILGAAAGAAVGATVVDDSDRVVGGVIGAVVGGAAGNLLTPQQEQRARKVIEKICTSLPSRNQLTQVQKK